MKIVKLTAENVKKITAVEITPAGEIVEITGKNGAGKTSVLDAIWWALSGTRNIQSQPIRHGAERARIQLNLGELVVERRFTEKGSTLFVENAEGARFPSPQAILDGLLGALTFDPLEFVNQDPKDQFDTLRSIVTIDVDLEQLDNLNRGDFARRTDINREAKTLRAQAEAIKVLDGLPDEPIDTTPLMDELTRAGEHNGDIEARKLRRQKVGEDAQGHRRSATDLMARAARLRQEADEVEAEARAQDGMAEELEQRLATAEPLPAPVDAEDLRRRIGIAQADNKRIEDKLRRRQLEADAAAKEEQAKNIGEMIAGRDRAKREAIARAKMPVEGVGFGDGIVTFNGVPFAQASTAEQIRVSLAIAMAANPKLRVIRIKQGAYLDEDNFAAIAEMARQHDYQVWVETVKSDRAAAVVIEDGAVATAKPAKEPAKQEAMQL